MRDFVHSVSCQKNFSIGGKGTLHGRLLSRRMHKRFLETYALSKKKKLEQAGRPG